VAQAAKYVVAQGAKYNVAQGCRIYRGAGYKICCGAGPQNILWHRDAEYTEAQATKYIQVD
jgi:hypothetical protein